MAEFITPPAGDLSTLDETQLLELLDERTRAEVERIDWVFSRAPQLKAYRGDCPNYKLTPDYLRLLFDPAFNPSHEQLDEMSYNQLLTVHVASDPVMWGKAMLNLRPRAYQTIMLRWPHDQKVLRLGRRLGKTWTLALKALHHVYTHAESPVVVVAPMKSHVELIYKEILRFAKRNEIVANSITRKVTSPQFSIELDNGSKIAFFTSGIRSGGRADVARGQEAHLIILDEADLLHMDDLNALYAMMQQTSDEEYVEKEFWASSTPTGRRELFWEWAHSDEYKEFWFPSLCNPNYDQKMDRRFQKTLSLIGYEHEILAVWGEAAEGVFPPRLVDPCFTDKEHRHVSLPNVHGRVVMGVDWDKYGAGTNIVACDYFPVNQSEVNRCGRARFLAKTLIPKGEYTLTTAVDKIIQWNNMFQPEHIYVDRGFGEMQVEELMKYGMKYPESHLRKRIKGFAFNENIDVYTPDGVETKELKHFMVDCTHRLFEEKMLLIPADEEELYRQLIAYMVVRTTQTGKPVFEAVNAEDHLLDAFMLCMLAISVEFLNWTHPSREASNFVPISTGALHPLARPPENEREEDIADKLKDKGVGFAVGRSFTSSTSRSRKKIDSRGIRRKSF